MNGYDFEPRFIEINYPHLKEDRIDFDPRFIEINYKMPELKPDVRIDFDPRFIEINYVKPVRACTAKLPSA